MSENNEKLMLLCFENSQIFFPEMFIYKKDCEKNQTQLIIMTVRVRVKFKSDLNPRGGPKEPSLPLY